MKTFPLPLWQRRRLILGFLVTVLLFLVGSLAAQANNTWDAVDISVGPDNKTRILWLHDSGAASLWTVNPSGGVESSYVFGPFAGWYAGRVSVGPDNRTRIGWLHEGGAASLWMVNPSGGVESSYAFGPFSGWYPFDLSAGSDNKTRLLWFNDNSQSGGEVNSLWTVNPSGGVESSYVFGPFSGWYSQAIATGSDNKTRILWYNSTGQSSGEAVSLWTVNPSGGVESSYVFGPFADWYSYDASVGPDNKTRILWYNYVSAANGEAVSLWTVNPSGGVESSYVFGPFTGWYSQAIATGPDNRTHILWTHEAGAISLWTVNPSGGVESSYAYGPF